MCIRDRRPRGFLKISWKIAKEYVQFLRKDTELTSTFSFTLIFHRKPDELTSTFCYFALQYDRPYNSISFVGKQPRRPLGQSTECHIRHSKKGGRHTTYLSRVPEQLMGFRFQRFPERVPFPENDLGPE